MHVFGTETHMTAIVGMALGKREIPTTSVLDSNDAASKMFFNSYDVRSEKFCLNLFHWMSNLAWLYTEISFIDAVQSGIPFQTIAFQPAVPLLF